MATAASDPGQRRSRRRPLDANLFEKVLAGCAILLIVAVVSALMRGMISGAWREVPAIVWLHIATIGTALVLTPVMLLRRRGDRAHRRLGYVWVLAMAATAVASLFVKVINPGHFSWIHILSVWTLIQLPLIVWHAREHRHAKHRRSVIFMTTGALVIAGVFTFPPGRLLGHWLFG